jgi:hypothetical protein
MKILQFTSLLFTTVLIHAFYTQNKIYYNFGLLIAILSILTHGYNLEKKNCIKLIDKIVAHFIFLYILLIDTPKIIKIQPLIILFPILLLIIWIFEHIYPQYFILLHSIFHLVSITTLHFHLYYLTVLELSI